MADSSDLEKRRRDLYAISLGIILYNTAKGSVTENATTLFGAVHLGRPWVLVVGAGVVWGYFLWQFLLTARGQWHRVAEDVDAQMYRGGGYRKLCARRLGYIRDALTARASETAEGSASGMRLRERADEFAGLAQGQWCFGLNADFLQSISETDVKGPKKAARGIGHLNAGVSEAAAAQFPMTWLLRFRIVSTALVWSMIREAAFSDLVLPLLVAIGLTGASVIVRLLNI